MAVQLTQTKFYQVNVQHSKKATANLMQMTSTDKISKALIQEPYQYQGKFADITKGYRIFACGEGKRRAAIIIQDNAIDALLITQLLVNDAVLLEIINQNLSVYAASVYYNEPTDNIKTVERILKFTKGGKLLLAIDSNSRSTTWHDIKNNLRWKALEEFLSYNQLHIISEDSARTTFQSSRRSSNIDLTIANNNMLAAIKDWELLEEQNCSDHNNKIQPELQPRQSTQIQLPRAEIYNKREPTLRLSQKFSSTHFKAFSSM